MTTESPKYRLTIDLAEYLDAQIKVAGIADDNGDISFAVLGEQDQATDGPTDDPHRCV